MSIGVKMSKEKIIDLSETDQLKVRNLLFKIQLENERSEKYKILLENSKLSTTIAEQNLKNWERDLRSKIVNEYGIEESEIHSIDADSGKVYLTPHIVEVADGTGTNGE